MTRRPPYVSHDGWLGEISSRPDIPRRVKRVLVVVADGTFISKRNNIYSITHEKLSQRLRIDVSNVKRAIWWAIDNRWLTVCQRGQKGVQQVYHRSVPWNAPRNWSARPCEVCGGYFTVRRVVRRRVVELEGTEVVDTATGEIIDFAAVDRGAFDPQFRGAISSQNRTPGRTPYVYGSQIPQMTLEVSRLVSLASRSGDWAGWQVVSSLVPYIKAAS